MIASALRFASFTIIWTMANAFVVVAPTTSIMTQNQQQSLVTMYGYVPDGLTAEQWKKIKAKEAEKKANLGKVGPR
jgi:urocanate hydratase